MHSNAQKVENVKHIKKRAHTHKNVHVKYTALIHIQRERERNIYPIFLRILLLHTKALSNEMAFYAWHKNKFYFVILKGDHDQRCQITKSHASIMTFKKSLASPAYPMYQNFSCFRCRFFCAYFYAHIFVVEKNLFDCKSNMKCLNCAKLFYCKQRTHENLYIRTWNTQIIIVTMMKVKKKRGKEIEGKEYCLRVYVIQKHWTNWEHTQTIFRL